MKVLYDGTRDSGLLQKSNFLMTFFAGASCTQFFRNSLSLSLSRPFFALLSFDDFVSLLSFRSVYRAMVVAVASSTKKRTVVCLLKIYVGKAVCNGAKFMRDAF